MTPFAKAYIRPVLIVTGLCTLPSLVLLGFGIASSFGPPEPHVLDEGGEIIFPSILVILSACVSFVVSFAVAGILYCFKRSRARSEVRMLSRRFGCSTRDLTGSPNQTVETNRRPAF